MKDFPEPLPGGPPYPLILKELRRCGAIPFLGAGASMVGLEKNRASSYLPSGSDLARRLARDANFPSISEADLTDLLKVSSYYVDVSSRGSLRRELRSVFVDKERRYSCNELHKFLAQIDDNMMVVITNYDTLLERA